MGTLIGLCLASLGSQCKCWEPNFAMVGEFWLPLQATEAICRPWWARLGSARASLSSTGRAMVLLEGVTYYRLTKATYTAYFTSIYSLLRL